MCPAENKLLFIDTLHMVLHSRLPVVCDGNVVGNSFKCLVDQSIQYTLQIHCSLKWHTLLEWPESLSLSVVHLKKLDYQQ